jgi:hypothetical protein
LLIKYFTVSMCELFTWVQLVKFNSGFIRQNNGIQRFSFIMYVG